MSRLPKGLKRRKVGAGKKIKKKRKEGKIPGSLEHDLFTYFF